MVGSLDEAPDEVAVMVIEPLNEAPNEIAIAIGFEVGTVVVMV